MPEPKIYLNGVWITEKQFSGGGSILKMSIKADKMIEFLNQHKNEKGYVNVNISARREHGKNGETHTASLDTWKPTGERRQAAPAQPVSNRPSDNCPPEEDGSGVPF